VLQGIVRDPQGIGQMGAQVQVVAANSNVIQTTFTDLHGHYAIANLLPGKYRIQASATLFVPAIRNLQLKTGGRTVVNLTLATLFETSSWLPSQPRRPDESADDWKWTLRSTANRPILRVLDDGTTMVLSADDSSGEGPGHTSDLQARAGVQCGSGGFGSGGTRAMLAANRDLHGSADLLVQAEFGTPADGYTASSAMTAGYERQLGFGTERTLVRYRSNPEIIGVGASGLGSNGVQTMEIISGQRTQLGDQVEMEAGGSMRAVHAGGYAIQGAPFLRLTAHPTGSWIVQYRLASTPNLQGVADMDSAEDDIPVAVVSNGKLHLEQGRHQQIMVARKIGHGSVQVTVYHDALQNQQVAGTTLSSTAPNPAPGELAAANSGLLNYGILIDSSTGAFRTLAAGYTANGAGIEVTAPLVPGLMGAVEYTMGDALSSASIAAGSSIADAAASLKPHSAEAAAVSVRGRIGSARIRAAYRWQPLRTLTAVNPYGDLSDGAYLSFTVRQPLRWRDHLPPGLDATIDVTNLLAQGYRPFLSADGQTLYFAQAPRTMQAGLAFSF
jgi:hypothetical protein